MAFYYFYGTISATSISTRLAVEQPVLYHGATNISVNLKLVSYQLKTGVTRENS
jgi:hypothetical protein